MKIRRIDLRGHVRTLSCGLAASIAHATRDRAAELESLTDPDQCTAAIVETCGGLVDATRVAQALDREHDVLVHIGRALNGEDCDLVHEVVREARDLRIRCDAVRRIAPEVELPDLNLFHSELRRATDKVREACSDSWSAIHEAARIASWSVFLPLRHCSDIGKALRCMARAGILPPEIDANVMFGKRADMTAPEGSPARNSAEALSALIVHDAHMQAERHADSASTCRQLVDRISAAIAAAEEQAA